jgi:hypothetical protein
MLQVEKSSEFKSDEYGGQSTENENSAYDCKMIWAA